MRRGDVDGVFQKAHRNADGTFRAVAGKAIPGKVLGGFRYHGTRDPDEGYDYLL